MIRGEGASGEAAKNLDIGEACVFGVHLLGGEVLAGDFHGDAVPGDDMICVVEEKSAVEIKNNAVIVHSASSI